MNDFLFLQFKKYPGLIYGFSNRKDGSMHRHLGKENRVRYFTKIGIDPARVVTADLVHGARVVVVREEAGGTMIPEVDGLVTQTKNLFISVTGADCFPLYFYDPHKETVGIAHIGWRGLVGGIVRNTVEALIKQCRVEPSTLLAGIGPGIRKCHFEIKSENVAYYKNYPDFILKNEGTVYIDLSGIIQAQLQKCGLESKNVEDSQLCTFCKAEEYFSYRRDQPKGIQSVVAYIGMR